MAPGKGIRLEHDSRQRAWMKLYTNGEFVVNSSRYQFKARVSKWPRLRGPHHDFVREIEIETGIAARIGVSPSVRLVAVPVAQTDTVTSTTATGCQVTVSSRLRSSSARSAASWDSRLVIRPR